MLPRWAGRLVGWSVRHARARIRLLRTTSVRWRGRVSRWPNMRRHSACVSPITLTRAAPSRTKGEIDALMNETQVLKLCLDVSHIALVGEDPVAHLRKYRKRLGYVHLKDWVRGEFVDMGQGTLAGH